MPDGVGHTVAAFVRWLDDHGEKSWDQQSMFAGPLGKQAKALYYRHKPLGTMAVAPLVALEALVPSARQSFHHQTRFPIADAHYAMGFALLHEVTGQPTHLQRAIHFLHELRKSRCPGFRDYCWGYPFDWVTRSGTIKAGTPLITSTPYVYEAFALVNDLAPSDERTVVLRSIVRHACTDIKDFPTSATGSTCSYTPYDRGGVINAAAYRAAMLTSASRTFGDKGLWTIAERNLNFVLDQQNADGSWYYAADGVRDFVDHFHTCFVIKALAKIYALTAHEGCRQALTSGVRYYLNNLFAADGMPRPFSRAPRMTVYRCELYDCAECINVCLLLRGHFPECNQTLERVIGAVVKDWVKPDGSFRSRRLYCGWDNVPMHRWGQSQMFRSLALYQREQAFGAALVPQSLVSSN
jgi:hypothetical protein